MSNYADSWTSTPWQQPDALHAVQHLQTLLCTAGNDTRDPTVPQRVCTVVGDILGNIEEKIKSHCKHKHLTHVEHRVDTTTGRDLVRIWKCTESKAAQNTATTLDHVLKEFTTTGRKLMLSTFGSRRYGRPLLHGR